MTIFFPSKLVYIFIVRLGPLAFLGRALRLGQARGPSAAARTGLGAEHRGWERLGAGRCSHMTNYIHVLHMRSMYKIDRIRGGGPNKIVLQEITAFWNLEIELNLTLTIENILLVRYFRWGLERLQT